MKNNSYKVNSQGVMEIGGIDVNTLVNKFGTPLYVYDTSKIEEMCQTFIAAINKEYGEGEGNVSYASKAFCCRAIYKLISNFGMLADVVSGGEIYTAEKAKFGFQNLIFHGNNKTIEELDYAIKNGINLIVIDNLKEADDINEICSKYGIRQKVLIRVNPGIEAHTHHYIQTATVDSKFGFSISNGDALSAVKHVLNKTNIDLLGLHAHIGSQIFEEKSYEIEVDKLTDFYKEILDKFCLELEILDLGGGFGIWYNEDDKELTLDDYYNFVKVIASKIKEKVAKLEIKKPYLIIEPGRSIVGEAGYTLYKAGYVKEIQGVKNYIAIDGGMFDNPRFALYQAKYTVLCANRMNDKTDKVYSVAGKCCESGDLITESSNLPKVKKGDILCVLSTGAYNYSMASNYNRNSVPAVVFVENGKAKLKVKRQTYKDLIKNDL